MSFANPALSVEYLVKNKERCRRAWLTSQLRQIRDRESESASAGISIDTLTAEQLEYISSWETGLNYN